MTLEIQTDDQIEKERQRTAARETIATRQARGLYGRDTTGQGALFSDDPAIDLFSGPAGDTLEELRAIRESELDYMEATGCLPEDLHA